MASERLQRQIEILLDEAEVAIKQLDWRVVHDRTQAVLAINPDNIEGLAFQSTADRALGGAANSPNVEQTSVTSDATSPETPAGQPTSFIVGTQN